MTVYFVALRAADPRLAAALVQEYPDAHIQWSPLTWLLKTSDSPQTAGNRLGVRRKLEDGTFDDGIPGVLIARATSNYWGFGPSSVWDWLKEAHQESA